MDEEAVVDDLIHSIKKGRMQYSLQLAVALLLGFGVLNFIFGNGMGWLTSTAWLSYIIFFSVTYFLAWPIKLGRAKDAIGEHEAEEVVASQGAQDNSWKLAVFILVGLIGLTFIDSDAKKDEEEQQLQSASVEMKFMSKMQEKEIALEIPESYINENAPQDFDMTFSPETFIEEMEIETMDMSFASRSYLSEAEIKAFNEDTSFEEDVDIEVDPSALDEKDFEEELSSESVMLSAKLDDIGLVPITGDQAENVSGEDIPYDEHELSPRTNPDMVAVEVDPKQVKIDEDMIDAVFDQMTHGNGSNLPPRMEDGLKLRSARVKLANTQIKGFVEVDEVQLGVPTDPNMKNMFVACENKICMLRANVEGASDASVYFHPSRLHEWDDIYWKMEQLLTGFVQHPEEEEE